MRLQFVLFCLISALASSALSWTANLLQTPVYHLLQLPKRFDTKERILKWGSPQLGTPARLTYAFATRPMDLPIDVGDCTAVEPFDIQTADGSNSERVLREIEIAFQMWEWSTNVRFQRIENTEMADLVIGMSPESSSITYARVGLGRAEAATSKIQTIERASICLDQDELWTTAPTHRVEGKRRYLSLRLLMAHEIGHVLGLDHPEDKAQLMGRKINEATWRLEAGDRNGIQILYGKPVMLPVDRGF